MSHRPWNSAMSIWLLLSYAIAMLAMILAVFAPDILWEPLLAVPFAIFGVGIARTGIRRPVV